MKIRVALTINLRKKDSESKNLRTDYCDSVKDENK